MGRPLLQGRIVRKRNAPLIFAGRRVLGERCPKIARSYAASAVRGGNRGGNVNRLADPEFWNQWKVRCKIIYGT